MTKEQVSSASNQELANGLSYDLGMVNAAQMLVANGEAGVRTGSFDDLVNYVDYFYGLDRDVVAAALDIAEARVLREMESNGEA